MPVFIAANRAPGQYACTTCHGPSGASRAGSESPAVASQSSSRCTASAGPLTAAPVPVIAAEPTHARVVQLVRVVAGGVRVEFPHHDRRRDVLAPPLQRTGDSDGVATRVGHPDPRPDRDELAELEPDVPGVVRAVE